MGERVEARRGGDARRHRTCEDGVENGDLGEEVRTEDDGLPTCRRECDDAGAADFAPGSRRGWNGDDGRDIGADEGAPIDGIVVDGEGPIVRDLEGDELAGVEWRASSYRHHTARAMLSVRRDALNDVLLDGIRVNAVEDPSCDTARLEQRPHALR